MTNEVVGDAPICNLNVDSRPLWPNFRARGLERVVGQVDLRDEFVVPELMGQEGQHDAVRELL